MYAIRRLTYTRRLGPGPLVRLPPTASSQYVASPSQSSPLPSKHNHAASDSRGTASFSTASPFYAKVRVGPRRDGFAKARFTAADVPSLEFWTTHARAPLVEDLSPEECLATAQKYVALALREPTNWRQNLTTGHDISLYTLHYIANMIMRGAPPSAPLHLATHILYTCVQLSYAPSILTMVRLAFMRNKLGDPQFLPAEEAFARVLAQRDDPDACTLKGLIYAGKNTREADDKAAEWFQLAMQIGGAGPQAWDWQSSCVIGLAKIYLKQNKPKAAREILQFGATTLDIPEACWLYANTLGDDDDDDDTERLRWLTKAAVSGIQAAARELAQAEMRQLDDGSLSSRERAERQAIADEWLGIAGDKVLY